MSFFSAIEDRIRRLETIPDAIRECVEYNKDEILQIRKDEILLGRDSDGNPFRPTYTSDPYFKSPQAAEAYADHKYRLEAIHNARIEHVLNYPNKDSNTPNLRLTRDRYNSLSFQDQMFIRVDRESYLIGSTFKDSTQLNAKYGGKVFDLGPGAKLLIWSKLLLPHLRLHLTK